MEDDYEVITFKAPLNNISLSIAMLTAKILHFDFFCLQSLQPWKLHSHHTADESPGASHKFMQFLVAWWLYRNLCSLFNNEIIRMNYKRTKLHRLEKHVGDTVHPCPSDPFIISCCHSGRPRSLQQKILSQQLFLDTWFTLKSAGEEKKKREASWHSFHEMQHAMLGPLWGLFSRQPGWASLPSLWRSSKPVEQPALLFWITDACTISEIKSLATELHSLPYFTHLAYSECVLWKFTTSCASVGFWGLYNRIVINCFVVLGWGHCIFSLTGSILFFSHWFPWVIPGSVMYRQGREEKKGQR